MAEHKVAVRMPDEFMDALVPVRSITRADMLACIVCSEFCAA